jgi:hypothetical protein
MKQLVQTLAWSLAVGTLAVAPALVAQEIAAPIPPPQPRIAFGETMFDFGKVKNTDTLKHEFIVTNTGTATLEITAVQPGCGCTMAGQWDRQIAPGQTGKIPLQLSVANFNGKIAKSITVSCNEPARPTHFLQLHAEVVRALDIQPQYLSFTPTEGEETTDTRTVRIISNQEQDVTIGAVQSTHPAFKTELKTVRPGKEFELQVTFAGVVSNTPLHSIINVTVTGSPTPLNVTAMAVPQSPFVTGPTMLYLPVGTLPAQFTTRVLTISYNGKVPVKLSDPALNVEGATVQLQETAPGRAFALNVAFPSNFQIQAGRVIEASVKTTHPKYPVVKVPVIQPLPTVAAPLSQPRLAPPAPPAQIAPPVPPAQIARPAQPLDSRANAPAGNH